MAESLAHVVDRECGDAGTCKGFHFDPRFACRSGNARDNDCISSSSFNLYLAVLQRQGMAERDQLTRSFGAHDTRQDSRLENGALFRHWIFFR